MDELFSDYYNRIDEYRVFRFKQFFNEDESDFVYFADKLIFFCSIRFHIVIFNGDYILRILT